MVKNKGRPVIIWVISIMILIGFVLSIPLSIIGQSLYGSIYAMFTVFTAVVSLFSSVGVFTMKRWGLQLYIWIFIVAQVIMLIAQWWTPLSFIMPFTYISLTLPYYKRMN